MTLRMASKYLAENRMGSSCELVDGVDVIWCFIFRVQKTFMIF
jgi:hypothetical protein